MYVCLLQWHTKAVQLLHRVEESHYDADGGDGKRRNGSSTHSNDEPKQGQAMDSVYFLEDFHEAYVAMVKVSFCIVGEDIYSMMRWRMMTRGGSSFSFLHTYTECRTGSH